MSSAAVFKCLAESPVLNSLGITAEEIFSDYSSETVPSQKRFIILRWGIQQYRGEVRTGPVVLTVWVHQPAALGTDFTEINRIHEAVREVLCGMEHVLGSDEVSVTKAYFDGYGGNLEDPGFHTVTRNAGYRVLLRSVW